MRTFTRTIASSVSFNALSPAISTSGQIGSQGTNAAGQTFSISNFGSDGVFGGPNKIEFVRGFSLQCNFGGNGTPSSGLYGGTLNLLVSNVQEAPMFITAASALISSTGSVMFNATQSNYNWVDFQFIPLVTSTSGFITAVLNGKAGGS